MKQSINTFPNDFLSSSSSNGLALYSEKLSFLTPVEWKWPRRSKINASLATHCHLRNPLWLEFKARRLQWNTTAHLAIEDKTLFCKGRGMHRHRKRPDLALHLAVRDKKQCARWTVLSLWYACFWPWPEPCRSFKLHLLPLPTPTLGSHHVEIFSWSDMPRSFTSLAYCT